MDLLKIIRPKESVVIHNDCKEISLHNYMKFLDTNDLRWFSNYHYLTKPKEPNIKDLENAMFDIYGQIIEINQDYETVERFGDQHKLFKLQIKINSVSELIKQILRVDVFFTQEMIDDYFVLLQKWGYKIDKKQDIAPQIEKIKKRLNALISDYQSLEIKVNKQNKSEKIEIESVIIDIERILEMRYKIEPKQTTLYEWLLLNKKAKKHVTDTNNLRSSRRETA